MPASLASLQLIDLGCKDEIAFGQPIDLVGPERDPDFPPGEIDIWMMTLLLGQVPHHPGKLQRLPKVPEGERPLQVVPVDHLPVREHRGIAVQLLAGQGRHATSAWNAPLGGEICVLCIRTHRSLQESESPARYPRITSSRLFSEIRSSPNRVSLAFGGTRTVPPFATGWAAMAGRDAGTAGASCPG